MASFYWFNKTRYIESEAKHEIKNRSINSMSLKTAEKHMTYNNKIVKLLMNSRH